MSNRASVLVWGLGNALLSDDGVGVHAVRMLSERYGGELAAAGAVCCDGGTIGLALMGAIEDAEALIVIDAARFGGTAGAIHLFEQQRFDARIRSARASAHDLALAELIDATRISGALPERRALIGIEPASLEWGLTPTPAVVAAVPEAAAAACALIADWRRTPRLSAALEELA